MASSSAQNHQQFPTTYRTTSAPPPTPSSSSSSSSSTLDSDATDLLSQLLHRLPPTLSNTPLLRRRTGPSHLSAVTTTNSPPLIPFSDLTPSLSTNLPSISQLGFFQLIHHSIPSQLAHAAESDSLSFFNLSRQQKHKHFPRNWPLGFDDDDEDHAGESLFLDSSCSTDSSELPLSSLREFTLEMEKIGLAVVEALSCAVGFENPARDDPTRVCPLMWISTGEKLTGSAKFYPCVIGLHYQFRSQNSSLLADSGWVSVSPETDSILVTLGDIAQVWSNGKLNKVRGKPAPEGNSTLSMSLLMTLPLESTVSPLLPKAEIVSGNGDDHQDQSRTFNSFSFEDYAWRVYHERLLLKDPLDRYRIPT